MAIHSRHARKYARDYQHGEETGKRKIMSGFRKGSNGRTKKSVSGIEINLQIQVEKNVSSIIGE